MEWEKKGGMQDVSKTFDLNNWFCHFLNRRLQETSRQFCPSTDKLPLSHHLSNYPLDPSHHYLLPTCFNGFQIGLSASTLIPLQSVLKTAARLKKKRKEKEIISGDSSAQSPYLLPSFSPHYLVQAFLLAFFCTCQTCSCLCTFVFAVCSAWNMLHIEICMAHSLLSPLRMLPSQ